jgi:hypothetical protein
MRATATRAWDQRKFTPTLANGVGLDDHVHILTLPVAAFLG